jgi:hypothetical protein
MDLSDFLGDVTFRAPIFLSWDQPTGLDTRVHGSRVGGMVAGFDLHDTSSLALFVLHFSFTRESAIFVFYGRGMVGFV